MNKLYKVGDIVTIRKDLKKSDSQGECINVDILMADARGHKFKITEIVTKHGSSIVYSGYRLKGWDDYIWQDWMFESTQFNVTQDTLMDFLVEGKTYE